MARLPRVVVPGLPHHVTQRGNRRQLTFLCDDDYAEYRRLLSSSCRACGTSVLAYCLMPNHVHLILVPADEFGLRDALGEAHRRYTRRINFREGWRGHLWQERFHSFVMDERHLLAAARYVERNPVRARLAGRPEDWLWSSAKAHLAGVDDALVSVEPLLELVADWDRFIGEPDTSNIADLLHAHASTGRPLGPDSFVEDLERRLQRPLKRQKPGPRPRKRDECTRDLLEHGEGN
ncbi:transposase [Thiocystis violacea]|uniref:transposase n=1 Tax=Thiocystis violacea TaxID=13725 RepID=UPI001908F930|nr:transposase [Thiocystis violacea]MBK1724197.1 transposase [Thiocystis violacea]